MAPQWEISQASYLNQSAQRFQIDQNTEMVQNFACLNPQSIPNRWFLRSVYSVQPCQEDLHVVPPPDSVIHAQVKIADSPMSFLIPLMNLLRPIGGIMVSHTRNLRLSQYCWSSSIDRGIDGLLTFPQQQSISDWKISVKVKYVFRQFSEVVRLWR